jgi:hypothetical protein
MMKSGPAIGKPLSSIPRGLTGFGKSTWGQATPVAAQRVPVHVSSLP